MREIIDLLVSLAVLGVLTPFTAFIILLNMNKDEVWGAIYERLNK